MHPVQSWAGGHTGCDVHASHSSLLPSVVNDAQGVGFLLEIAQQVPVGEISPRGVSVKLVVAAMCVAVKTLSEKSET